MDDLAPPPVDAHEPPPRRRGLGRGLDELRHAGSQLNHDGQRYYGIDSLMNAMFRLEDARLAERTAQPAALHRMPEPLQTGPINVAEIMAGVKADPPKQRTPGEAAAWLNEQLRHPSEAIRVRTEAAGETAEAAEEPVEREAPSGLRAGLAALDEIEF